MALDGNFAGGFAEGFNATDPLSGFERNQTLRQRQQEQEQQNLIKEREFVNKNIETVTKTSAEIAKQYQTTPSTPEKTAQFKQAISQTYKVLMDHARAAQAKGVPGVLPPEALEAQMNSLLNTPSFEELQATQIAGKVEETKAIDAIKTPTTKQVIDSTTGQAVFATEQQIQADPARFTPVPTKGQTINIGGSDQTEFQKQLDKKNAESLSNMISTGQSAVITQQNLEQMATLLSSGVSTGTLQPLVTGLQGIASDLGVDVSAAAKSIGLDVGNLKDKEEFDRVAQQVIIDGFEKFKGNLNAQEVKLAINSFANLGRSEDANIEAVAAGLASQQIARERAIEATLINTKEGFASLQAKMLEGGVAKFKELKEKFKKDIMDKRDASLPEDARLIVNQLREQGYEYLYDNKAGERVYLRKGGDRNNPKDIMVLSN